MWWASGKIKIALLAAALILAGIFFFLISKGRKPIGPHLSLALLGYTNDAAGVRYDCFSITNLDQTPVIVLPAFIITNETGVLFSGYSVAPATLPECLRLGEFQIIAFPTPTNQMPWKLQVSYVQDPALRGGLWGFVEIFKAVMSGGRRVTIQHEIRTDWIDGKPRTLIWTNSDSTP